MLKVCVVGLGKIGLPLAVQYTSKGCSVIGCDINEKTVSAVNNGCSPVNEPGLQERLERAVEQGRLEATLDTPRAVRESEVIVVIVPLIIDDQKNIDHAAIDAATRSIAKGLQKNSLVIYETTLPVGTTRKRLGAILAEGANLRLGRDFHLAFSPERVYSGRVFADLNAYPKIVGGIDITSLNKAVAFYSKVLDAEIVKMPDTETAELIATMDSTGYEEYDYSMKDEDIDMALNRAVRAVYADIHNYMLRKHRDN